MVRGTTSEERREAVTVITPGEDFAYDDDVEKSFNEWRASFEQGEEPGKLRAYQIPLDSRGNPIATAKNQILLGSWPIDLYGYDELCTMLIRDFMTPEKILAVRFIGTEAGKAGIRFNKILVLRAPKDSPTPNGAPRESTSDIMRAINENNERLIAQFRAMIPPQPEKDVTAELQRMMVFTKSMNEPMMAMLGALLPALAGRPAAPAGDPFTMLSGLVDVFGKLQELRGEGEGGSSGNDIIDAIRAIVPIAKPAIEAIPSIMADRARQQPQPRIAAPPGVVPPHAGAVPPGAGTARPVPPGMAPTPPPTAAPAPPPPNPSLGDIPSEDQKMFAQLKPQIDALVAMAGQGSDATGAADLLFDQVIMSLPDDYYSRLSDMIGGENFITQAAVFNPSVNTHRAWFETFQKRVVERYEQEDEAARTAPTPTVE